MGFGVVTRLEGLVVMEVGRGGGERLWGRDWW